MPPMELQYSLLLTIVLNVVFLSQKLKLQDSLGNICFAKHPVSEELQILFPEMENVSVWTLVSISKYVKVYYNLVSEILN